MQKVTPFLWFNDNAEEAVDFYKGIFKDAEVADVMRAGDNVMGATIVLGGQRLTLFNGGPMFQLNEAFSLYVSCDTQEEIDYYWNALIANGGKESRCGWLEDKFGMSWQIVPPILGRYLSDANRTKANSVMQAMMGMNKLDIAKLQAAYEVG